MAKRGPKIPKAASPESIEFAVQPNSRPSTPTAEAYEFWQEAFHYFNDRLFQGALNDSVITLTRSRALGYFCPGAFQNRDGASAHEISMNPTWFDACGDVTALSILNHEMVHQWRHDFGPLNRKGGKGQRGYHDTIWADKMEALGLVPSNTGEPGGRRLGFQMSHYIIEGGRFERACRDFLCDGNFVDWHDGRFKRPNNPIVTGVAEAPATSKGTRTRFVCACCDVKAYARASARLACLDCEEPLIAR